MSSQSNKTKLFAETFSKNSNLYDSVISSPVFSSGANRKLHNTSVTPKMVKKVIMNLELEICYMQAEILNKCLKESCFPDRWKVSLAVLAFKDV